MESRRFFSWLTCLVANPNLNLYLSLLGGGVDKITTMKMGNPDVRKKIFGHGHSGFADFELSKRKVLKL